MFKSFAAIFVFVFVSGTSAVFWDDLRVKWGVLPIEGFFTKLPRLVEDALSEGWVVISADCENGGEFSGFRYKLPRDDYINLLFDVNGVIAGVQVLLPHEEIMNEDNPFRYDLVPMFRNETVLGRTFVVLTAYFVPPESICSTGRTPEDLLEQGTGTGLWFQNGPSPNSQIEAPLTRPEASEIGWTDCECFPGMGLHNFWEVERWQETNCDRVQPTQLTFNLDLEMTGFVFQIFGPTSSQRFETPPNAALTAIIGPTRVPQCILDHNTEFGASTIHFYMVDRPWTLACTQ